MMGRVSATARIGLTVPFFGTKVVLGPIWILAVGAVTWAVRSYYVPVLGASLSPTQAWFATAVILVAAVLSLLVHAAGHLLAARLLQVQAPERLPLYLSGDAAQAWPAAEHPSADTWVAMAGPFASLATAGVSYLAWHFETATAANEILLFILLLNVGVAGLNLAPGFPLDGGRLIRAEAWPSFGSVDDATKLVMRIGWVLCVLLAAWAAFLYLQHLRFSIETSAITLAVALLLALELLLEAPCYVEGGVAMGLKRTGRARLLSGCEIGGAVLLLSIAPALLLPTNLGMEAPGPTASVESMVHVPPDKAYPATGTFILTTIVPQAPIVVAEWLYAQYDHAIRITPAKEIVSNHTSPQQVAIQGFRDLQESEKTSIVVGLQRAGYQASLDYVGAEVVAIQAGSKANGLLKPGDQITSVNGQAVAQPADVSRLLAENPTAESAELMVQRDDAPLSLSVPLTHDEAGTPRIGINVSPTGDRLNLPFPVSITPQKVDGGPSAGLMFTLTVYNALTPGDVTMGHKVAGTGTISLDGSVGAIGGVQQKVAAAERAGAEYFLVPAQNYDDAVAMASRIKVVKVSTFDDALAFLQTLSPKVKSKG